MGLNNSIPENNNISKSNSIPKSNENISNNIVKNVVTLKELSVKISGHSILKNINLFVAEGSIVFIVGPSGAGKSTLLRIIAMLEKPTLGQLLLFSEDVSDSHQLILRRKISIVHQTPYLFNGTVLQNVCYPLWVRKIAKKERENIGRTSLNQVGILEQERRIAKTLSGGQAQRLALARALITKPEILLLDEVTAHLDPANVAFMEDLLVSINSSGNSSENKTTGNKTTIIMASHNLFQAKRLSHQVAFLFDGNLIESSPSEEFFEDPKEDRTKDFLMGKLLG